MKMTKTKIQKIKEIAKKYKLALILLFGSQVGDKKFLHKESDFDIGVLGQRKITPREEINLTCDFIKFFNSNKVDIVDLRKANPLLLYEIFNSHKILFCKDKNVYEAFKIYAQRRYREARVLFELRKTLLKKFLNKYAK
ncbi:MAG: nucleotidyltransferase domain-containing protein [Candidatus Pacebacteria bacterium]|nr:nucleotidyltransferase domain-containing protein [Candidatus Paceibacterota bacterium]